MATRAIVTLASPGQSQVVKESGVTVICEYSGSVLVRGEQAQLDSLKERGIEVGEIQDEPIRAGRTSFTMSAALNAETRAPAPMRPNRRNYFLVQLSGPPLPSWLDQLRAQGASIQDSLSSDTLLIGALPDSLSAIREFPWVEAVTPYRPAMKLSMRFRPSMPNLLGAEELASVSLSDKPDQMEQIEVSLFPNESTEDLAAMIREQGGMVLRQGDKSLAARVPARALAVLAEHGGVEAILPHEFPKFSNDRATNTMRIPENRVLLGTELRGEGEIIAVADSGLDTGNPLTVHADFRGRIVQIRSLPLAPSLRQWANGPAGFNDGAADLNSGHGTHVAGSVLGDGSAARSLGTATIPTGAAPKASLFFQAVEQKVDWKPTAGDIEPFGLYGLPENLETLFDDAYLAGSRFLEQRS